MYRLRYVVDIRRNVCERNRKRKRQGERESEKRGQKEMIDRAMWEIDETAY